MWELETTHHGLRPLSPFLRDSYTRAFEEGTRVLVERWGLPLAGVRAELVNGCMYVRPTGVGEGAKPMPTPPKFIMKLIVRLHPDMRRRNRTAALAWKERSWRREVDTWFDRDRAAVVAQNLAFQAVDCSTLDSARLAAHIIELLAHFQAQAQKNLETHGGDLIPVGDLLRRALLDAGRRLVASGALVDVEHVAELAPDELSELLAQRSGPSASEIVERAATRDRIESRRLHGCSDNAKIRLRSTHCLPRWHARRPRC